MDSLRRRRTPHLVGRQSTQPLSAPRHIVLPSARQLGWGLLFIHLVASPLVFSRATVEAFELNKVLLLYLVAIILGALGLSHWLQSWATAPMRERIRDGWLAPGKLLYRDPIALGVVLFLLSALASTV